MLLLVIYELLLFSSASLLLCSLESKRRITTLLLFKNSLPLEKVDVLAVLGLFSVVGGSCLWQLLWWSR